MYDECDRLIGTTDSMGRVKKYTDGSIVGCSHLGNQIFTVKHGYGVEGLPDKCIGHVRPDGKIYNTEINSNSAYCIGRIDLVTGDVFSDEFTTSKFSHRYKGRVTDTNLHTGAAAALLLLLSPEVTSIGGFSNNTSFASGSLEEEKDQKPADPKAVAAFFITIVGLPAVIAYFCFAKMDAMAHLAYFSLIASFVYLVQKLIYRKKEEPEQKPKTEKNFISNLLWLPLKLLLLVAIFLITWFIVYFITTAIGAIIFSLSDDVLRIKTVLPATVAGVSALVWLIGTNCGSNTVKEEGKLTRWMPFIVALVAVVGMILFGYNFETGSSLAMEILIFLDNLLTR